MGALFSGGGDQRGANTAGQLDHPRETCGVRPRLSGSLDHKVVASDLAFQIDPSGDPMDHRMQCEYRLEQALKDFKALPRGPVMGRVPKVFRPAKGYAYARTESPKGEIGFYIESDGKTKRICSEIEVLGRTSDTSGTG